MDSAERGEVGALSAASVGIGGMVGGGIFAVLGLAVSLTGGAVPIAFLVGGSVAAVTAYSYVKLATAIPERGGTVAFIDRAFGVSLATGTLNVLLLLSYIVMVGFYASAFGLFGASFFDNSDVVRRLLIALSVLVLAGVNFFGAKLVLRVENSINAAKVLLLVGFVVIGFLSGDIDSARFATSEWVGPVSLVGGAMVIFLNYEGFELIATVSPDIAEKRRARTLAQAFGLAVGFTIVLYVGISIVAAGVLNPSELLDAREFALAEAAESLIGRAGFVAIAISAMLATASAITATLFSAASMATALATDEELPADFSKLYRGQPIPGLLLVCVGGIVLAEALGIETIAAMGSSGFLATFAAVNVAAIVLRDQASIAVWVPSLGLLMCVLAIAATATQVGMLEILLFGAMVAVALSIELITRVLGRSRASE